MQELSQLWWSWVKFHVLHATCNYNNDKSKEVTTVRSTMTKVEQIQGVKTLKLKD